MQSSPMALSSAQDNGMTLKNASLEIEIKKSDVPATTKSDPANDEAATNVAHDREATAWTSPFFVNSTDKEYRGRLQPIVLGKYKLIFFTVAKNGCSVWKMLFRRMEGYDDWNVQGTRLVHVKKNNGLKYLSSYSIEEANAFFNSPEWTIAMFLRDPFERFASAYLDKARKPMYMKRCCASLRMPDCAQIAASSPDGFFEVASRCRDNHWEPQSKRLSQKYWQKINFVGRFETLPNDAEKLLRRIGAWEEFGVSGWGANGTEHIFSEKASIGRKHATNAKDKYTQLLDPPASPLMKKLAYFYREDFTHPILNFTLDPNTSLTTEEREMLARNLGKLDRNSNQADAQMQAFRMAAAKWKPKQTLAAPVPTN